MATIPHVAVLVETSRSYGRGMLRGLRRYLSEHGPWSVFMELRALESEVPSWLRTWKGDGILTRTTSQATADAIRRLGVPTVELRATKLAHSFPFVGVNNAAMGQMVAEHLIERGFVRFGVWRIESEVFFQERCDNFQRSVEEKGFSCSVFPPRGMKPTKNWETQQARLTRWIDGLEKPVGILACNDQLGYWVLDACRRANVAVPEQAAVVGVENDETLCTMAEPPLSSVCFNAELIGYAATELLDRLMRGETAPSEPILVDPVGIVTRQSSDIVAMEDTDLAAAVRFIRENACEGISVNEVLQKVPISRTALERKMRAVLKRSPKAEITRLQLERVKQLLVETDLSLTQIAGKSGFRYPQYMVEVFKKWFGETPGTYRSRNTL
ncbi:Xylose operon regulatory protein [Planctomycetes bacterium Pan216]|uniref:Xylose operon regulatory protein n=1 Tax=Kolteria novifilia TaxID=2527975 RepID=A0A518B091_9BACT|nr:Xylose operon regulatory protein [Planctomycetes bacterium Pan216]